MPENNPTANSAALEMVLISVHGLTPEAAAMVLAAVLGDVVMRVLPQHREQFKVLVASKVRQALNFG